MVSPRPLSPAASVAIRGIYADAEAELFRRIARNIAQGIDGPGWEARKLADILRVRAELELQIAEASGAAARELRQAIATNYGEGFRLAAAEINSAGGNLSAGLGSGGNKAAIRALANESVARLATLEPRILRASLDVYRSTVAQSVGTVLTGAQTRRDAAQAVLDRFANRGITGFVDRAGREWDIASYSEMATRTGVAHASRAGHQDTLRESGFDLVIVSTSPARCPLCDPWEGRVLSMSGTSRRFPSLADAQAAGLFHPNCTHRTGLYVRGLTQPAPARPPKREREQLFEDSQAQRYNERQIRAWKRREAVAITPQAEAEARAKVRAWQAEQRALTERTGRRRNYGRETIRRAR